MRRIYTANFAKDLDISQHEGVRECLAGLAADLDAILKLATEESVKTRLRNNTDRAIEVGIFGSPTFVVDNEVFWGNDRMEAALRWRH